MLKGFEDVDKLSMFLNEKQSRDGKSGNSVCNIFKLLATKELATYVGCTYMW